VLDCFSNIWKPGIVVVPEFVSSQCHCSSALKEGPASQCWKLDNDLNAGKRHFKTKIKKNALFRVAISKHMKKLNFRCLKYND
jgi:hypothetical protein